MVPDFIIYGFSGQYIWRFVRNW